MGELKKVLELEELFFHALYGFRAYWSMGKIGRSAVGRIKQATGINVSGYEMILHSNDLVHFYNSHYGSQEYRHSSRGIRAEDIRQMPMIMTNFTRVRVGNTYDSLLFEKINASECFQLVVKVDEQLKTLVGKSFRINT